MIELLQYMKDNNDIALVSFGGDCFFPVAAFEIETGIVSVDVMGKIDHNHYESIMTVKSLNTGKIVFD